jgi:hypothetical protein
MFSHFETWKQFLTYLKIFQKEEFQWILNSFVKNITFD